MKIDKKIRQMPWPDGWHGGQQDFIVSFSWPVVDHERLLVATFIRNRDKKHWSSYTGADFRLICSKKQKQARILYRGARTVKRELMRDALQGFHAHADSCYPEISKKDEETLGRWLSFSPEKSHNHLMPQLADWVADAVQEEVHKEKLQRGEIMDEDVRLCPEEFPEGLVNYIRDIVLPQDNVLIYKKGNIRGTCYLCREKVKANRDYLNDCVRLHWNLDDPEVLFPRDLAAAHQRSIEQVKYEATKEAEKEFQETRAKAIWQEWELGDLLIRWPISGAEIVAEGQALHHCVGGYVQRAANGTTTILFIRQKSEPEKPFFTLEWCGDRVVQCKGIKNFDYRQEKKVSDFVDAWLEHIQGMKQYKKKEKAA